MYLCILNINVYFKYKYYSRMKNKDTLNFTLTENRQNITINKKNHLLDWIESCKKCPHSTIICRCNCEEDNSKNALLDKWSIAHVFWGCVYSIPLFLWDLDVITFLISVTLSIIYEIVENSQVGSYIAGKLCCTQTYQGDNFWNSVFDIICCQVGFCIMFIIKHSCCSE